MTLLVMFVAAATLILCLTDSALRSPLGATFSLLSEYVLLAILTRYAFDVAGGACERDPRV